jgi:hypothetical protein
LLFGCATTRALPSEVVVAPQGSSSAIVLTTAAPEPDRPLVNPPPVEERVGNIVEFGTGSSHAPHLLLGSPLTLVHGGRIVQLGVISVTPGPKVMLALYTDAGGEPGRLVAWTSAATLTGDEMLLPVAREVTAPAGDYWIMGVYDVTGSIGIDYSDLDAAVSYTSLTFGDPMPDPFPLPPQTYKGQRFNYFVVLR